MPSIDALAERLSTYLGPDQVNLVRRAYFYAEQAHDGQRRRSGEAYVTHPLAVASILADMHMDHQSLMAAMLHDVIEDTGIAKEASAAVRRNRGRTGRRGQQADPDELRDQGRSPGRKLPENGHGHGPRHSRDPGQAGRPPAQHAHAGSAVRRKRRRIAKETLEIYAPIANRLGMHTVRVEFEDLGFKAMHPMRSR
jgi:(p)ppGpp synthase/HD superfamily hydrolase